LPWGLQPRKLGDRLLLQAEEAIAGILVRLLVICIDFHKSRVAAIAAGFDDAEANREIAMSLCRAFRRVLSVKPHW